MHKPIPEITEKLRKKLKTRVYITGVGCWLWLGGRNPAGYGFTHVNKTRFAAHRMFYAMHYGVDPADKFVCHTCDNPSCVNPEHLWLGTNSDNQRDCVAKGRASVCGHRPAASAATCAKCGHLRTDDYCQSDGQPRCRNCQRLRDLRVTERRRAAKAVQLEQVPA